MAVRAIDANELYRIEKLLDTDIVRQDKVALNLLEQVLYDIQHVPTLTQPPITGDTSDGYHTFNELYHHRAILFSVICNERPEVAWKSKRHHDGTMYDGMFIVGIDTPEGQATYHYDIDPYWNLFRVKELELAPEWDGHTPGEAIRRIGTLTQPNEPLTLEELREMNETPIYVVTEAYGSGWCILNWHGVNQSYTYFSRTGTPEGMTATPLSAKTYGDLWTAYRRPPEGEEEEKHVIEITENL